MHTVVVLICTRHKKNENLSYIKAEKFSEYEIIVINIEQNILLCTECQSSFIPVSYWLRKYHVIVEKFNCLPGNVAKRWTLLLIHR